jgi:hypothetical protein
MPASAQESADAKSPSLSETLRFIEGKVNTAYLPCITRVHTSKENYDWSFGPEDQKLQFRADSLLILEGTSKQEFTGSKVGYFAHKGTKKVSLKDLNAADIEIDSPERAKERAKQRGIPSHIKTFHSGCSSVTVNTFNSSKLVAVDESVTIRDMHWVGQRDQKRETEPTHSVSFYFNDEEVASRVAKALKHAIELSGAKKESF